MKEKSKTLMCTGVPSTRPEPQMMASLLPPLASAASIRLW